MRVRAAVRVRVSARTRMSVGWMKGERERDDEGEVQSEGARDGEHDGVNFKRG